MVDVTGTTATNPNYGRAIPSSTSDESEIRAHKGWMGRPLAGLDGVRHRIYDSAQFEPADSLLPESEGGFESGIGSWTSNNVNINQVTNTAMEGSASLRVSNQITYNPSLSGAWVRSLAVTVSANDDYTIAFSARSSVVRAIQVVFGGINQTLYVPTTWQRYVFTAEGVSPGNYSVGFNLGREDTQVWIDAVYVFRGNTNVFRRDFDRATVVVNATNAVKIVDLGTGTYRRVYGTDSMSIVDGNDGHVLTDTEKTNLTVPAFDVAILIRVPPSCLFCDYFDDGVLASNWTYEKPSWSESEGNLIGIPDKKKAKAIASPAFSGCLNCSVQATMTSSGGEGNRVWLLAWRIDKDNTVELLMKEENDKWVLKQRVNKTVVAKQKFLATIDPNVPYTVLVSYDGTSFQVTINVSPAITMTPAAAVPTGTVGFQNKNTVGSFGEIEVN